MDQPVSEPTPEEFAARARTLELVTLSASDLETLRQGYVGLGAQLARVRSALQPTDRPDRPKP
jgi:hypothetical protein